MSVSIDEQIARTVEATLLLASESELFVDPEPFKRRAVAEVIATFACRCAPADPSPAGLLLAVRLLAILLYLDDLPKDRMQPCLREMFEVLRAPAFAPTLPQARALGAYVHELDRYGNTTWFKEQFERCLSAVWDEAELLAAGPLTVASYKAIRRRVIGVEEYLWTWLLAERMPFDAAALGRTIRLRQLASDVVYLVNDLGSVERDRVSGAPNLVSLIQHEQGLREDRAIEAVIRSHEETAAAYRAEANDVRMPGATPGERAIVEVVEFVVRGNLVTTKKLSGVRYPGAEERLARLVDY